MDINSGERVLGRGRCLFFNNVLTLLLLWAKRTKWVVLAKGTVRMMGWKLTHVTTKI